MNNLSILTGGTTSGSSGVGIGASLLVAGISSSGLASTSLLNAIEMPPATLVAPSTIQTDTAAALSNVAIYDATGKLIAPVTRATVIDVGNASLSFDPTTLQGVLSPVIQPSNSSNLTTAALQGGSVTYSGSDIRLMIEVADPLGPTRWAKQFMECTVLTISIHRVKDPARACGFIGAKGHSRGGRTIAGTIVLTEFAQDALYEFLSAFALRDKSKDSNTVKVDQLPPFNMSILFANEAGYASSRQLMGIEFVTDGTVYSIQDSFTERTISYLASDLTPLMPVNLKTIQTPSSTTTAATAREQSPQDLMKPPSLKINAANTGISYA